MDGLRIVALLKQYGWLVNLSLIAAGSYFVAGAVNTVVAQSIRVVPSADEGSPSRAKRPASRRRSGTVSYTRITERNLFGAKKDPEIDPEAAAALEEDPDQALGSNYREDDLRSCTVPATLRATLVAEDNPQWSMAVFYDNSSREPTVFSINDGANELSDDATLVEIRSRAAVVRRRDHFELCSADEQKPAGAAARPVASTVARAASESDGDEVQKTGDNEYLVSKDYIDETMGNLSKVATQARIVPSFKNGKANGFKLFSIKPNSIYQKIGLQNGDVIQKINGYTIDSPDKALEIYSKLKTSRDVNIELLRRGRATSKNYNIR
ncbi:MAG: type II secretion system protein GspC [Myxococcota bacterium]